VPIQQHQQWQVCAHTTASTLAALCPYTSLNSGKFVPTQQHQQWQLCAHTTASTVAALCPYNSLNSGKTVPIQQHQHWQLCAHTTASAVAALCPYNSINSSKSVHIQQFQQWQLCAHTTASTVATLCPYNSINSSKSVPIQQHQQWQTCAHTSHCCNRDAATGMLEQREDHNAMHIVFPAVNAYLSQCSVPLRMAVLISIGNALEGRRSNSRGAEDASSGLVCLKEGRLPKPALSCCDVTTLGPV